MLKNTLNKPRNSYEFMRIHIGWNHQEMKVAHHLLLSMAPRHLHVFATYLFDPLNEMSSGFAEQIYCQYLFSATSFHVLNKELHRKYGAIDLDPVTQADSNYSLNIDKFECWSLDILGHIRIWTVASVSFESCFESTCSVLVL